VRSISFAVLVGQGLDGIFTLETTKMTMMFRTAVRSPALRSAFGRSLSTAAFHSGGSARQSFLLASAAVAVIGTAVVRSSVLVGWWLDADGIATLQRSPYSNLLFV
jgi:hypothetical protein